MPDDDALQADELIHAGGSWHGLLFQDSRSSTPSLTWCFTVDYQFVQRDYGDTSPNLCVEWVPLASRSWRMMQHQRAQCSEFGQPIESSLYFFQHHRFDSVRLDVLEQQGRALHIKALVEGDIDGVGLESLETNAWLDFRGIYVLASREGLATADAETQLRPFTDVTGLIGAWTGRNYLFAPQDESTTVPPGTL